MDFSHINYFVTLYVYLQAKNVPKDILTDVPVAQRKLGACIQEILQFESTYQIITNADISIEVSDQFSEVFLMMGLIEVKMFLGILYIKIQNIIFSFIKVNQQMEIMQK